ncbi:hypothetical protein LCGC14_3099980, partial [marine sediment metagenome]
MKALVVSTDGSLHGIAARIQDEGWSALFHTSGPRLCDVPRSMNFRADLRHVDLCVAGRIDNPNVAQNLRDNARFVFGANADMEGVEASAGSFLAFFNGLHWLTPFFEIVSLDRMLSGDLGAENLNMAVAL